MQAPQLWHWGASSPAMGFRPSWQALAHSRQWMQACSPLLGHDDPHGSLAAKQAEHAAHRAEVVAPDPPDEEEFGQDDDPDERQLQPHGPLVDEAGGLDRDDPWGREQAGQGETVQQGGRQESRPAPHSGPAKQDPGVKKRASPSLPPTASNSSDRVF